MRYDLKDITAGCGKPAGARCPGCTAGSRDGDRAGCGRGPDRRDGDETRERPD